MMVPSSKGVFLSVKTKRETGCVPVFVQRDREAELDMRKNGNNPSGSGKGTGIS
jgi:hypothetical protein